MDWQRCIGLISFGSGLAGLPACAGEADRDGAEAPSSGDPQSPSTGGHAGHDGSSSGEASGETAVDEGPSISRGMAFYFGTDAATNTWTLTVVDPTYPGLVVDDLELGALAELSGPHGNGAQPRWGDAVVSPDNSRIFVNATSVNRVAVIDVSTHSLEALIKVGEQPVHIANPGGGAEIWTHAAGEGVFHVLDRHSLAVSETIELASAGDAALVHAEKLGATYFATGTSAPAVTVLDGEAKSIDATVGVCGRPCDAQPEASCGGVLGGAYNPRKHFVVLQCSGASDGYFAVVDAGNASVVQDLVAMRGSIASDVDGRYILVMDDEVGVQVWDTQAPGHDGISFDAVVEVSGQPSARGTIFRGRPDGAREAWIPQGRGSAVIVLNLETLQTEAVDIGPSTAAPGDAGAERPSAVGGGWFFNANAEGIVYVDLESREVTQGPATSHASQVVFVEAHHHEH